MSDLKLEVGKVFKSEEGDLYDVVEHTPGHRGGADFTCVNRRDKTRYAFSEDDRYDPFHQHPRNFTEELLQENTVE